jgi:hypothetical protein
MNEPTDKPPAPTPPPIPPQWHQPPPPTPGPKPPKSPLAIIGIILGVVIGIPLIGLLLLFGVCLLNAR